ncbi:hypothetical protein [Ornithinibacillus contaminans]|nr:hypothetical protein [Ornithinibacillus contaminans]
MSKQNNTNNYTNASLARPSRPQGKRVKRSGCGCGKRRKTLS